MSQLLNEPQVEEQSLRDVDMLREDLLEEEVKITLTGYVEGIGTMGSTLAVKEWDGGVVRIRVGTEALRTAEKVRGEGEEQGAG